MSYLQDFGELPSASCLRADPVHLRADTNGLILFDTASFELDENDSRALVETLAGYLAADGWDLLQGHPHRWYLSGKQEPDLITIPLPQRRGSPVSAAPFAGKDAAQWMIRLNEMQMLMHNHPVNRARAARGQAAVNSVWLWGAGDLQTREEPLYTRLSADNVCAQGAARLCGMPAPVLTQNANQLLSGLQPGEHVLSVLEGCRAAAAYEDFGTWQAAVEDLERDWFVPLVQALRAGWIDRLELLPLNGKRYRLERRHLKFFWKRVEHYGSVRGFRRTNATRV
jgi:hypothetical protein